MSFEEKLNAITVLFRTIKNRCKKEALGKDNLDKITMAQMEYLITVHRLGTPTLTEISNEMKLTKASVTVAIDKLIKQSFLYKVQSENDSRVYNIHLDKNSYKLLEAEQKSHKDFAIIIQDCLTEEELSQLDSIYGKIISKLGK